MIRFIPSTMSIQILLVTFILTAFLVSCNDPSTSSDLPNANTDSSKETTESDFDLSKAKKYGADNYGMRKYVIAFLKRGPKRNFTKEKASELQAAHMENIGKMAEAGKLVLAGPFLDNGDLRGIYIFNVKTIEEAKLLTETDPAIQAGSLEMELKEWYGSAALMEVNEIHSTLAKEKI